MRNASTISVIDGLITHLVDSETSIGCRIEGRVCNGNKDRKGRVGVF